MLSSAGFGKGPFCSDQLNGSSRSGVEFTKAFPVKTLFYIESSSFQAPYEYQPDTKAIPPKIELD